MTIPLKHIPEIKVKSYQGGLYVHRGEVHHLVGDGDIPFLRLDDAAALAKHLRAKWKGWKSPIILNSTEDKLYYVYINHTPKNPKTFTDHDVWDDLDQVEYPITLKDRLIHTKSMYGAGNRGIQDMSHFSRHLIHPPPDRTLNHTDISPDYDIVGFDHPRTDIYISETASGKTIRAGGDTFPIRDWLTTSAKRVLDNNFTKGEVRKMNLHFEGRVELPEGAAADCTTYKGGGIPVSIISIGAGYITEDVLTHEVIHALRAVDGRKVQDRDIDEIETDYETKLRVQNLTEVYEGGVTGYYSFIPHIKEVEPGLAHDQKIRDAIKDDRLLAFGATGKPLKGRRLTHNIVPNTVKRSRIATAKPTLHEYHETRFGARQMIAEDVDTYFQIKLPDKSTVEYHIRFDEARPSPAKIKKHLKDRFGKNIEAWEWKDGKRVRLISRRKKRTTTKKRTTKKATTRKTPSKRRVPAAKTPNQYLKGIPPIPGGFL